MTRDQRHYTHEWIPMVFLKSINTEREHCNSGRNLVEFRATGNQWQLTQRDSVFFMDERSEKLLNPTPWALITCTYEQH